MDYKSRIELTWSEEFAKEYMGRIRLQAERAARAVGRKYGPAATAEIMTDIEKYIAYALGLNF